MVRVHLTFLRLLAWRALSIHLNPKKKLTPLETVKIRLNPEKNKTDPRRNNVRLFR